MKQCVDCGDTKSLDQFALHRKDGERRRPHCKPCGVERTRVWQNDNKERKRATGLRWFHKHKEAANAAQRKRRKRRDVRTKDRAYQKAYRKAHPDTTTRLWRKRWREAHPVLVKELACIRAKRRYARMKGAKGHVTPTQLRSRIAYYGGRCWMCGVQATEIDHVKPIAKGGAHLACNLRPACGACNRKKSDIWPWRVALCS